MTLFFYIPEVSVRYSLQIFSLHNISKSDSYTKNDIGYEQIWWILYFKKITDRNNESRYLYTFNYLYSDNRIHNRIYDLIFFKYKVEIAYYSKIFTVSFFYSFFYWPIYMHYFNISKQTKSFFHPKISIKSNMH